MARASRASGLAEAAPEPLAEWERELLEGGDAALAAEAILEPVVDAIVAEDAAVSDQPPIV